MILDLLNDMEEFDFLTKDNNYIFDGKSIPRVTEIISSMIHEEYLMNWANSLGFKHKSYRTELNNAALIRTQTHNAIESIIKGKVLDITSFAIQSFSLWWDNLLKNNTVEILGQEQKLCCKWFGGTYDFLVKINGKIYLTDFKTSNHLSYKYYLQLAAYRYLLSIYNISIDGVILLQLDKNEIAYEEQVLEFENPEHLYFIDKCTETFFSLVYAFYNINNVKALYSNIF